MSTEPATQEAPKKLPIAVGSRGLQLNDLNDMWRFAVMVSNAGMAPKGMEKPEAVCIALQAGAEIGLTPMQSIQNIAPINGRPSLWGKAVKALVEASGLCEEFEEWETGTFPNDDFTAHCKGTRVGRKPVEDSFSIADAKRAGLWQTEARVKRKRKDGGTYEADNDSPWYRHPKRMLKMRARARVANDVWPDVLMGLGVAEEERDFIDVTASDEGCIADIPDAQTTPQPDEDDIGATIARAADALDDGDGPDSAPETQTDREPGDEPPDETEPPQEPSQADRIAAAVDVAGIDADAYDAICESLSVGGMDPNLMDGPTIAKLELAILKAGKKKGAK